MSEQVPIEGKIIPAEVSEAVFAAMNQIFADFHAGFLDGETSYRRILQLYWENTDAPDEARHWIMDESFEICLIAEVDVDRTGDIWVEEMERAN